MICNSDISKIYLRSSVITIVIQFHELQIISDKITLQNLRFFTQKLETRPATELQQSRYAASFCKSWMSLPQIDLPIIFLGTFEVF